MANFLLLQCTTLIVLAAAFVAAQQPLQFRKHKTINNLPLACQQHLRGASGGDSTEGPCTLLDPVYDASDYSHDFCVVCSSTGSGSDLSQSIQTLVGRKVASDRAKFTRKSDLFFLIKGIDQPMDVSSALSSSPVVLHRVEDVYYVFGNGQMGRVEYKHGLPERLESVTCRMCAGGIGQQQQPQPPTGFGAGSGYSSNIGVENMQARHSSGYRNNGYSSSNGVQNMQAPPSSGYRNYGYQNVEDDSDDDHED